MPEPTAVIDGERAVTDAYRMGFDRGPDGIELPGDGTEGVSLDHLDGFKQSATYANHTLPSLRAMAGFADRGYGTYQEPREVVVIPPGGSDGPSLGIRMPSDTALSVLVDAWDCGYLDAVESRPADHTRAERIVSTEVFDS